MALVFYYGSGSGPAWKVWLSLLHKGLPFELRMLSFQDGDLKKPEFLAVSPRGKVPTLVDDGFSVWESSAIVGYLDAKWPEKPVVPRDPQALAKSRRVEAEHDLYVQPAGRRLFSQTLHRAVEEHDPLEIEAAKDALIAELALLVPSLEGPFFLGKEPSLADYTVYPTLAMLERLRQKQPAHDLTDRLAPALTELRKAVEALPYYEITIPPHWRA